ncbi:uncharacterized protein LOC126236428 isoform X2 [Schistocerca nitens]|uniref:uncharacterized protein LOC126236428 isoform X2 n=1 Tax=Schistocerca nitens TaxID=7011 RepID=UPI002118DCE7|nr:uncharacterized protein LOC126236428 isoform X2 [Schistocerca nitens]
MDNLEKYVSDVHLPTHILRQMSYTGCVHRQRDLKPLPGKPADSERLAMTRRHLERASEVSTAAPMRQSAQHRTQIVRRELPNSVVAGDTSDDAPAATDPATASRWTAPSPDASGFEAGANSPGSSPCA